jgi:hypothetical protein
MRSKIKFILIALFLFSFLAACTSVREKEGWAGKIEEEDGIEVIYNPEEPLYGEIDLELEEDLVIGAGEEFDENYNFRGIASMEVDDEGNILVLDYMDCRIQKYDKDGKYLQTIGRKGEGPGEFQRPSLTYLAPDGKLYVNELRKLHVFDENQEYERSIILKSFLRGFGVTKEGNIMGYMGTRTEEEMTIDIALIDPEGKRTKTIASYPDQGVRIRRGNIMIGMTPPYSPGLFFYPVDEDSGIYGFSAEYKLFETDAAGEIVRRIEKEEKRQPTSKSEESEYIKKRWESQKERGGTLSEGDIRKLSAFAEYKPYFTNIIMDDEGNLFLPKPKSVLHREDYTYFDFFNRQGYYFYKIKISDVYPRVIKKGCIYTYGSNPDTGYYEIERYRIKNWDQVKK